jgi:hypothetical protein
MEQEDQIKYANSLRLISLFSNWDSPISSSYEAKLKEATEFVAAAEELFPEITTDIRSRTWVPKSDRRA